MKEKMEDKTTEDKWKKLDELLQMHGTEVDTNNMGEGKNPYTHVKEALHVKGEMNPEIMSEIEKLGFKVIRPKEISEIAKANLEKKLDDKTTYELQSKSALIVDSQLEQHSMRLVDSIEQQYFSLEKYASDYDAPEIGGAGKNELIEPMSGFRAQYSQEYDELLKSLGFKTEQITNENGKNYLKVHTDGQMLPVKQSKLSQIYTNAKDKIKGIFNKIKTLATKSKTEEQVKDDSNER